MNPIDHKVIQIFALVSEALAKATYALLNGDTSLGQEVIDGDQTVDSLTAEVELLIWEELQERPAQVTICGISLGCSLSSPNWSGVVIWPSMWPNGQWIISVHL